eukprot:12985344-Alexandrium_andersonii.AAC.1
MAAGHWRANIDRLARSAHEGLLSDLVDIGSEARHAVLEDFYRARSRVKTVFTVKLRFLERLPYKL